MKKTHNISLFIYDEAKIKENAGRYFFVKFFMPYIYISDRNNICFLCEFMGMEGIIKNRVAVGYGRNWLSHFIYFN